MSAVKQSVRAALALLAVEWHGLRRVDSVAGRRLDFAVRVIVCHWLATRPVLRISGRSASGRSSAKKGKFSAMQVTSSAGSPIDPRLVSSNRGLPAASKSTLNG